MRQALIVLALSVLVTQATAVRAAGVRGEAAAVAAAERLLESVGGRQAWRARNFTVEERGFLRSGEVAQLRISRDLQRGAYYGPLADMGDANLPKWGAASNGSFRFEYISARLSDALVTEPSRTRPRD